jgi:hypothetical protein
MEHSLGGVALLDVAGHLGHPGIWGQLQMSLMAEVAEVDDSDDDGAAAVFEGGWDVQRTAHCCAGTCGKIKAKVFMHWV